MANPYTYNGTKITTYKDGSTPSTGTLALGSIFENEYYRVYEDLNYLKYEVDDIETNYNTLMYGVPSTLDTLAKIASAINNDPTYSVTVAAHINNNITSANMVHGIQQGSGHGFDADTTDGLHTNTASSASTIAARDANADLTSRRFISTITTGTSPLSITSTTVNTNLNADMVDDKHIGTSGNYIPLLDGSNTWSGAQTYNIIPAFNGGTTGSTAPFTVDSTYLVSNLNADMVDGYNVASLTDGKLIRYNLTGTKLETGTVAESGGALSSITSISMSGAITATTSGTINGLSISSGALSGISTLSMGGALSGVTTLGMSGQLTNTVTGVAPFVVSSAIQVANLNASLLQGYGISTSGANIPLLNGANTWSAQQTISANLIVDTGTLVVDSFNHRVGIGTTSPLIKAHIQSTNTTGTGDCLLLSNSDFNWSTTGSALFFFLGDYSGTTYSAMQAYKAGNQAGNLILNGSGGNVCIGTSDPGTNKLKVSGNIYATGSITADSIAVDTINASALYHDSIEANNLTNAAVFSALSPYIPNVSDNMPVHGRIDTLDVYRAYRASSTTIYIYYLYNTPGNYLTVTSGSGTTFCTNGQFCW